MILYTQISSHTLGILRLLIRPTVEFQEEWTSVHDAWHKPLTRYWRFPQVAVRQLSALGIRLLGDLIKLSNDEIDALPGISKPSRNRIKETILDIKRYLDKQRVHDANCHFHPDRDFTNIARAIFLLLAEPWKEKVMPIYEEIAAMIPRVDELGKTSRAMMQQPSSKEGSKVGRELWELREKQCDLINQMIALLPQDSMVDPWIIPIAMICNNELDAGLIIKHVPYRIEEIV